MKKVIDDTFVRVRGKYVPGISKLIEDYAQDLGEYITVRYLEEYKRYFFELRVRGCLLCAPENRHIEHSSEPLQWRDDEHLHRQTFRVYTNEPGFEDRVIWIAYNDWILPELHGHYLRSDLMTKVIKEIFGMYSEEEGQMCISYSCDSRLLETAHERKLTVMYQLFGPLIKPLSFLGKVEAWSARRGHRKADAVFGFGTTLLLISFAAFAQFIGMSPSNVIPCVLVLLTVPTLLWVWEGSRFY